MRRPTAKFSLRKKGILLSIILGLLITFGILYHRFFQTHSKLVPTEGGIFTESTIGTIKNLNPLSPHTSLFDKDLHKLIFSGLLRYNPTSGKIEDGLAHLQIKDNRSYTLSLKDSARFQDGQPVTTDDVLFTFESLIKNPHFENKYLKDAFEYTSIQVVDDQTIEFKIPEPNFFFPGLLTTPILPAKYFKNAYIEEITDPQFSFNQKPIGAGPYRLTNIVSNFDGSFRVFLEKNKYYYTNLPKIEQIVFYVHPSFEHLNQFHSWTTIFSNIPLSRIKQFQEKLIQTFQLSEVYEKREYLLPRFTALFFNLDTPLPANPIIRKALSQSLDKTKIIENETSWQELESFFLFEGISNQHDQNAINARRILQNNGFPYKQAEEQRIIQDTKEPLTLNFITSTAPPVYSRFAQNITHQWEKELNLKINLEILPPEEFRQRMAKREYDIILFGQNFSQNFDSLSLWHSAESGKFNLSNLTNEDIDFLINEVRTTGSQTDLFTLSEKLTSLIPAIPLATPKYNLLISQELKNFSNTFGGNNRSHADRFFGIETWYFKEEIDWDLPPDTSKLGTFFRWLFTGT